MGFFPFFSPLCLHWVERRRPPPAATWNENVGGNREHHVQLLQQQQAESVTSVSGVTVGGARSFLFAAQCSTYAPHWMVGAQVYLFGMPHYTVQV